MTDKEILYELEIIMDTEVTPALASHGGGGEITKVEDGVVYIELEGGCKGCPGARMTMKNGIETIFKERFQRLKRLLM